MTYFEVLKRVLHDYKNFNKFWYYMIVVFWIITTLLASIEPFFWAKGIEYIEKFIKEWNLDLNALFIFFGIWIGYIILNSLVRFYYRFNLVDINTLNFYIKYSKHYKDKILSISQWVFLWKKPWSIYKKYDRWIEALFMVIFNVFLDIFTALISIILITWIIFFINYKLAIATLFVVPIFIYMWYYFNHKTRLKQQAIHKKWDRFYGDLSDYVTNLTLAKTLNFEKKAMQNLNVIQDENLSLQIPLSKSWSVADIYTHFMVNISRFIVLWIWIYLISQNEITFWVLFLFYSYIWYIYFPLSFIFSNIKNLQKNLESVKKMYEEFDNIELDVDLPNSKDIQKVKWRIEFKNLNFSYNESKKVLENINFSINPWEKIALVWSTWSWKSTITNLLLRFWDNYEWEILLDWKNIKKITKTSIRKHIWIVMQDNTLFNTSIRKNLELIWDDITEDKIIKALKKAKADFVFNSKDGLETIIWERGLKLSWWEKQRLNIARIFLKNPEILILDEATSALDNKTEIEIQSSLDELLIWKTSIIIAHRLSTIKKVDKIFVMDNWKIIETWTYDELLDKKWYFYKLANPEKLIIN